MTTSYRISPEQAPQILRWLTDRGGLLIWQSINLSNPGASWTTPALTDDKPTPKPNWQCGNEPNRTITDPAEVMVEKPRKVAEIKIKLEQRGMKLQLTIGSSKRLRSALAKWGGENETAYYTFGDGDNSVTRTVHALQFGEDIALIWVSNPADDIPILEWEKANPIAAKEAVVK